MQVTILSFMLVTALIALISWYKTKGDDLTTSKGYFLAGRGLTGIVIGFSMVLTSLSTEQLIGQNGVSFNNNFSIMAWTVTSVIPLCVLAKYMLPRYIKNGYTTIPEFFEKRFDKETRVMMSILFLLFYCVQLIPTALYTGAIAFNKIFSLQELFGVTYFSAIFITVWIIGIIGGVYAIFGGLKAVAISDTLNAVAVIIAGLLVPYFGLKLLGHGNFGQGLTTVFTQHVDKLNAIGGKADAVPWTTLFTAMMFIQFFYWTTNQGIVQRALGAKNLKEGQKGILVAAFFLLSLPIILNLPGTILYHLVKQGIVPSNIMVVNGKLIGDLSYPIIVKYALPKLLLGFFLAAMLGAILSTFNSFVNSAATLFCKDILPTMTKREISDKELILIAKKVSTIIALVTMIVAPFLMYGTNGIFLFTKKLAGLVNIPIIALFAVGMLNKTVSAKSAKVAMVLHIIIYATLIWIVQVKWNFLHVMGALFIFDVLFMLISGEHWKRETPYVESAENVSNVDINPWEHVDFWIVTVILSFFLLYLELSKLGFASESGKPLVIFIIYLAIEVIVMIYYLGIKKHNN